MKIRFDTPPMSAQQSNGLAVRYAAAKREVPRWRWYLMLAVIGLPLMYFVSRFAAAIWWETAPGFVVVPTLTVKAGSAGTVRDIVAGGSVVARGATLLRVDAVAAAAPAPISATTVTPAAPRPAAARSTAGPDDTVALLGGASALAERTLGFRRARLAAVEALVRDGAATRAEADAAAAGVAQAEADWLRARVDLQARRDALHEQARAANPPEPLAAPGAAPNASSSAPAAALVTSPYPGTVTSVLVVPGEYVTPATEVLLLQSQEAPMVEAYVAPSDAKYAKVGRHASLHFFDGTRLPAVVVEVAGQTARIPAERVGPLSPRSQAILVRMRPEAELPARLRINVLPLDVRFDTVWPWSAAE